MDAGERAERDAYSDLNLFVDADGTAFLVRYAVVNQLAANYTHATSKFATFPTPSSAEAPVMFRRAGVYYIISGKNCCACRGGLGWVIALPIGAALAASAGGVCVHEAYGAVLLCHGSKDREHDGVVASYRRNDQVVG